MTIIELNEKTQILGELESVSGLFVVRLVPHRIGDYEHEPDDPLQNVNLLMRGDRMRLHRQILVDTSESVTHEVVDIAQIIKRLSRSLFVSD